MREHVIERPQDEENTASRLLLLALRDGKVMPLLEECAAARLLVDRGWLRWISILNAELTPEGREAALLLAVEIAEEGEQ